MPQYRGLDQKDICTSIVAARGLLRAHSTGPALDSHLDKVSGEALEAIATARTDAELSRAIADSYVEANFVWVAQLLRFHAEADTDGRGLDIYRGLLCWGALSGNRAMILSEVDVEIEKYIGAQSDATRARALFNAAAVSREVSELSAFKAFVIEIAGMKEGLLPDPYAPVEMICEELTQKYAGDPSFKRMMIGAPSAAPDAPQGIVFIATLPVAVAIADAYPAFKVKTAGGTHIPAASSQPKTPAPKIAK